MLKKLSKKGLLVFASVLALAAFVTPSMASAASWGGGATHVLDSSDLNFINHAASLGSSCKVNTLHSVVSSAAVLTVTAATFSGCMGLGTTGGQCTTTPVAGGLPWTATGLSTTNIQIHNINVTVTYANTPGNPTACPIAGVPVTVTGTLASPGHTHWDALAHQVTLFNATGVVAHSAALGVAGQPVTINGTIRDRTQTLTLS